MSSSEMKNLAQRWLSTATDDLVSARILRDAGRHAHACFLAQQSGEKAVKAMWYSVDADPWGHSVQKLLQDFPCKGELSDLDTWTANGSDLDKFYIPTRYPNGLPDLTPHAVYGTRDSERAVGKAGSLLKAAASWIARHETQA
jgi:HEPN domain-containing protein